MIFEKKKNVNECDVIKEFESVAGKPVIKLNMCAGYRMCGSGKTYEKCGVCNNWDSTLTSKRGNR